MPRFSQRALFVSGFLVILACGATFFWQQEKASRPIESLPTQSKVSIDEEKTLPEKEEREETFSVEAASPVAPSKPSDPSKQVTAEDCEQGCESFSTLPAEQSYCRSFCGLNQETYLGKNCMTLVDTERDVCFKEQAIREHNAETCARIGESSLRKVCEARIAEELFD
jgi:hypothetical protein